MPLEYQLLQLCLLFKTGPGDSTLTQNSPNSAWEVLNPGKTYFG